MTAENLIVLLEDLYKDTEKGKLSWHLEIATSEYRDPADKPVAEADGETWTVDECYVGYSCQFRGTEFSMITYENIETAGEKVRSINLVFLPPVAMRLFQLDELAPYAVETSSVLTDRVHRLWKLLLEQYAAKQNHVKIDVRDIDA